MIAKIEKATATLRYRRVAPNESQSADLSALSERGWVLKTTVNAELFLALPIPNLSIQRHRIDINRETRENAVGAARSMLSQILAEGSLGISLNFAPLECEVTIGNGLVELASELDLAIWMHTYPKGNWDSE